MTTIKSYTSLKQSKKLSEILPFESADMYYEEVCNLPKAIVGSYILHNQCMEDKDYKKLSNLVLSPAWSLAALLGVLPEGYSFVLTKSFNGKDYYCKLDGKPIETMADSPVDACYKMILNLHELNLL